MNAAKIKCRALMVGDWCCDQHGFPMQITNVGDDYAYATFEGNEGDPWEFDDKDAKPQPIEITEDILKQNNWEVQGYTLLPNEHYCVKYIGKYCFLWSLGTLSIWFDHKHYNDGLIADIIVSCKYVHQLQQVLRLAGMAEMANNFKI